MLDSTTQELSYAYQKGGEASLCFRKRKRLYSRWSARHPVGLIIKFPSMKRTFNKGGRPVLEAAQRQKYIVSARLDSEHYFRLKKLARTSGCQPAEVIRQLIGRG